MILTVSLAPTGSGKTVLFELALIRLLMSQDSHNLKCVYMAPTKVRTELLSCYEVTSSPNFT